MSKENFKGQWKKVDEEVNELERQKVAKKNGDFDISQLPEGIRKVAVSTLPELARAKEDKVIEKLSEVQEQIISLRWRNLFESIRECFRVDNEILGAQVMLELVRSEVLRQNPKSFSTRNPLTDGLVDKINNLTAKRESLKELSPEAFIGINLLDFKKDIKRAKEGGVVETPYVREVKDWIMEKLQQGIPIFLHGHLGAGKTEVAIHSARESMLKRLIMADINKWLEEEKGDVDIQTLGKKYREIERDYRQRIESGDETLAEKISPYVVIGNRDFTLQDLYTEKTLVVENLADDKSMEEHLKAINSAYETWIERNQDKLSRLPPEEAKQLRQKAMQTVLEVYKLKNTGFGTEVKKIEKELYKAIKEGKPIIIDEANAIPAAVFVSMNDILTKRPGDIVHIPGEGAVRVQEGFAIIMTGNINSVSSLANYVGTEEMNPAFLSRLAVREYSYLPQNTSGTLYEQNEPEKNELFRVLVALLAYEKGGATLPEGSWEKIFALAQLARVTQDVFSGKWRESDMVRTASGDTREPRLKTAVMSTRALIKIIEDWNMGQEKDLDKALWDSFISGITDPEDQHYILQQAQRFGFFQSGEGWDVKPQDIGAPLLTFADIRQYPYRYTRPADHTISPRDMIEMVFGKAPGRIKFPDVELYSSSIDNKEMSLEEIAELQELNTLAKRYAAGMEVVIEKECSNLPQEQES